MGNPRNDALVPDLPGKAEVIAELMRPIREQFAESQILTADRFIAEGDHVSPPKQN
jgi:hypothetical protein